MSDHGEHDGEHDWNEGWRTVGQTAPDVVSEGDAVMEGRWTIHANGPDGCVAHFYADTDLMSCPVVPCDDAAIERAVRALATTFAWDDDTGREIVVMALRAAGETP